MKNVKLRLGPLPKSDVAKITINVTAALKDDLESYARAHSIAWGQKTDVLTLIPFMLETFIARDRAFKRELLTKREQPR